MSYTVVQGRNTEAVTNILFTNGSSISPLVFQDGAVQQFGVNGTTNEEVLEALIDRLLSLQGMQGGRFACKENAVAITHIETALAWLRLRTYRREQRGVEGTDTP